MNAADIFRPPAAVALSLAGPVGLLEAKLEDPGRQPVRAFGVVCHPHPLHGGTMDNKVVHTAARAMQELGAPTLRFNYRGVGASEGGYADGVGERDDALAVIADGRARWPGTELWLAGFSFGAAVALAIAADAGAARLITIAPPVGRLIGDEARAPGMPWLLIQGDADELVDAVAVTAWCARFSPAPQLRLMNGASHFFHGRITELRRLIVDFLR